MSAGSQITAARLRLAALAWAAVSPIAWVALPMVGIVFAALAALCLAAAALGGGVAQALLAPQARLWMFVNRGALAAAYWAGVAPVAIILRVLRIDPLRRSIEKRASFW